jgi:hypothetical protein
MAVVTTPEEFNRWLKRGKPGSELPYFYGFLLNRPRPPTALLAWHAYEQGLIDLVQFRSGPDEYTYIAQKRKHPHENPKKVLRARPQAA